jgi:hypothetical protein
MHTLTQVSVMQIAGATSSGASARKFARWHSGTWPGAADHEGTLRAPGGGATGLSLAMA